MKLKFWKRDERFISPEPYPCTVDAAFELVHAGMSYAQGTISEREALRVIRVTTGLKSAQAKPFLKRVIASVVGCVF